MLITVYGNLFSFLLSFANTSEDLIILGNFNLPDIDWDTLTGHSLVSNQFYDSTPTRIRGNIKTHGSVSYRVSCGQGCQCTSHCEYINRKNY